MKNIHDIYFAFDKLRISACIVGVKAINKQTKLLTKLAFMKKKLLMLFLGTFLFAIQAIAQQVTVTGKITSSEDGLPIPGASVKIKGTNFLPLTPTF